MHTMMGSSGGDCVMRGLFYFNFMALWLGFLKVICSGCVSITTPANFILEEEQIQY